MTPHTPGTVVRPARSRDTDELFRMASLLATSAAPRRSAFEELLASTLHDPHQCLLVAEASSDGLMGYLHGQARPAFHANGHVGWVEELFVDQDHRSGGVGRRLMVQFERWAVENMNVSYFAVATRRAASFYESVGYSRSATYFKKSNASIA